VCHNVPVRYPFGLSAQPWGSTEMDRNGETERARRKQRKEEEKEREKDKTI
jgi:hypothetical protein